jgi:hypothetical protein
MTGVMSWFRDNKDALIAVAALVAPLLAVIGTIISAIVSYRAVVTGPRIQREIARDTIRMTQAQITSGLYGAADHQWIVDFRAAIAQVISVSAEHFLVPDDKRAQRMPELGRELEMLAIRIQLMVSPPEDGEEFRELIRKMIGANEQEEDAKNPRRIKATHCEKGTGSDPDSRGPTSNLRVHLHETLTDRCSDLDAA